MNRYFIDCGAHCGESILHAKRLFGQDINVISFEGIPYLADKLTELYADDNSIMKVLLDFADENRNVADDLWNEVIANKWIAEIFDNINRAKKTFRKSWVIKKKAGRNYLVNPFQKLIAMEEKDGSKKSVNKLMAHMLLGIEASILVFVMEEEQKDFIMPHHDGWVSLIDWKTNTLESIII